MNLDSRSLYLRRLIVTALEGGGRGHLGSALSLVEILRVLYDEILKFDPANPKSEQRDRFILSKGHGCLALYAILADKGFFDPHELRHFCRYGTFLGGHPEAGRTPGVEASTGALGHGLPIAVGMALGLRLKKNPARVYVVMGDGEINEGSVWEAAMSAAKHSLDNLTALVDYNKLQSYGPVDDVMPLEPLADKWRSFGFNVSEVDGHDCSALSAALQAHNFATGKPRLVVCHTVKGKGVPFAENVAAWHHKSKVSDDDIAAMRACLGGG
ncbi:MAG: transketolase [Alphaproteobacteria bacterium]|nr:transketolase [Alphaproteobacteria bacterium]